MATRTVTVMPDLSDKEVIDKENVAEYTEEDGNEYAFSQGLEEFDVIVAVNGLPVNNMDDLSNIIPEFRPDDIITLMVLRQGGFKNIKFKLSSFDFDYLDYYNKQQEKRQQSVPAPPDGPE